MPGRQLIFKQVQGETASKGITSSRFDVGLDPKCLETDMANRVVNRNLFPTELPKNLSISTTPGFIISTKLVSGTIDLNGLKELIKHAEYGK